MGLLAARQAEMAEAVVSWSRLRSRIAMIGSLTLAQGVLVEQVRLGAALAIAGALVIVGFAGRSR